MPGKKMTWTPDPRGSRVELAGPGQQPLAQPSPRGGKPLSGVQIEGCAFTRGRRRSSWAGGFELPALWCHSLHWYLVSSTLLPPMGVPPVEGRPLQVTFHQPKPRA